eukprot:Gregarina_sp_Pseudo_9__5558@NODE_741_length_2286_cov_75_517579_g697_i0_p1_GENE_NODE_741_length_2286_cov_75_517579_g697_i0NODE_741_length_2286_cov_75_517579_g697_i0_p1_ORF_typecomplete_len639_score216_01Cyclin_N/PF00134_23/8_5e05_NODE_741_length_2286_cov_75_517579_g697_i02422158
MSSDYSALSAHYSSGLNVRQSLVMQRARKRVDVSSQRVSITHPPATDTVRPPDTVRPTHPSVDAVRPTHPSVDSVRPTHPGILRSSCSLPVASVVRRGCAPDEVMRSLRKQMSSDPSLGERRAARCALPQFRPCAFVLKQSTPLLGEEVKRLSVLLDITSATVRNPEVFCHLLRGEMRVLLDPVSQKMEPPAVSTVRWRQPAGDGVSLASASTSTSLSVSLNTSMGAIDECEQQQPSAPRTPLHAQPGPLHTHTQASLHTHTQASLHTQGPWGGSHHVHWTLVLVDRVRHTRQQPVYPSDAATAPAAKLITRDTRQSVVTWMSKVIEAMGWPLNSFFTAVHAMDYSLKKNALPSGRGFSVPDSSVPLLSTACVLVGVSAECEHRQLQKARAFVGQVPHVASVKEIVCKQLAVVAGLDRGTLLHKTPLDFMLYYLAALRLHSAEIEEHRCCSETDGDAVSLWDKLFQLCVLRDGVSAASILLPYVLQLGHERKKEQPVVCFLELVLECALAISVACYLECVHTFLPLSRIVAAILFSALSIIEESFKDLDFCAGFCRRVFGLDYATELRPVLTEVMPLIYIVATRQFKGARSSDKSDVSSADSATICNDSTFTSWSYSARVLLDFLEEVAAYGPTAFPQ